MAAAAAARRQQRRRQSSSSFPLVLLHALVLLLLVSQTRPAAAATPDDDPSSGGGGSGQAAGRYPLMARLAPCLPLPVHSNCSAVPATLQHNLLTCAHVSFQAGGYGQGARSARLAFEVEADDGAASPGGGSKDGGLTMVLLVGSTLWFEDQAAMYAFLQPRLAAALQASHGYDPTLEGPCMGGRQEEGEGGASAVARRRVQRRRRLLRGPEQEQEQDQPSGGGDGVIPFGSAGDGDDGEGEGGGLPSCADVVAAFNSAGGLGGAAAPFAFLYTCNVTSATRPPQPPTDQGGDDSNNGPSPQLLAYDDLRPDDYPFTYFVFINANVDHAAADGGGSEPSSSLEAEAAAAATRAVNQTVRYAATFSPTYMAAPARLPQPAFALLLLLCAVAFVGMSAYVSAPVLDWLATTRCGKRCLQSRV